MMTALYRRYRPDTFEDVIGQEHVTRALQASLANGRINHAYLFSGPRGCGKTTSARILARCLNCAEGPTPTPCGKCDSCKDLATGGPGSLDVVEIDAASHNGVDDARELRERATFAPARDRFKIFILDEAHMVTPQGFNALLKLVEEPPPHIKFIFATTDPDKVIGTIRSRTHHYPFRLVAPEVLRDYLADLCKREGVSVEEGVLGLAVRAGGGSVRDSLSILDQLMAGESEPVLHYNRAVALLGYTDAGLLSGLVDGLVDSSGAEAYEVVDRMIQTGHEPRRFVEDLLQYLRNLVILRLAGQGAEAVLGDVPESELEKMREQVAARPPRTWTRAAELVNEGLSEMVGASSPRLSLELLVAKLLLEFGDSSLVGGAPTAANVAGGSRREDSADGEKHESVLQPAQFNPISSSKTEVLTKPVAEPIATTVAEITPPEPSVDFKPETPPHPTVEPGTKGETKAQEKEPEWKFVPKPWAIAGETETNAVPRSNIAPEPSVAPEPNLINEPNVAPEPSAAPEPDLNIAGGDPNRGAKAKQSNSTTGGYEEIRSKWGEVMAALKSSHSATASLVSEHGQLQGLRENVVEVAFKPQMVRAFSERHTSALAEVINKVTGMNVTVRGVVAGFGVPQGENLANSAPTPPNTAPVGQETEPTQPDVSDTLAEEKADSTTAPGEEMAKTEPEESQIQEMPPGIETAQAVLGGTIIAAKSVKQ